LKKVELSDIEQQLLQSLWAQVGAARAAAYVKETEAQSARDQATEAENKLNTALAVIAQLHGFSGAVQVSPDGRTLTGE
jgi:hypothetical protein